jgi:putative serine/threonine protein kinase
VHEITTVCKHLGAKPGSCNDAIREAEEAGINCILDIGRLSLGGVKLLGKGWAGFVVAALLGNHPVALKVLNPAGRRVSLLGESVAALAAGLVGAAKKVLYPGVRILAYELAIGPLLGEYQPPSTSQAYMVLEHLLDKAYRLDAIGLRHNELARPEKQVIIDTCSGELEPYILDYESATWIGRASNLPQIVGGLPRTPLGRKCGIPLLLREKDLRSILRRYKQSQDPVERKALLRDILSQVKLICLEEGRDISPSPNT